MKRILYSPDANTEGSSSETFRTVSELQTEAASGEMGAESTSQPSSEGDQPTGSLNDFVSKTIGKELLPDGETAEIDEGKTSSSMDEHDKEKGKEKEEVSEEQEEEQQEQEEQEQETETEAKPKVSEDKLLAGKDPIPVDRFKEVITERNSAREQIKRMQATVDDWHNLDQFCKANAISPEQFKNVVEIQALLNTDPAQALTRLIPIVNELQGFVGNRLPDDLKKAVDDGEISEKYAREVAKSRAVLRFGEGKLKHDRERIEAQRQNELQQSVNQSVTTWETAKRESDPDYKPKSDANAPDGKWELVQTYIKALASEVDAQGKFVYPITSGQAMTALMEKAYAAINNSTFTRKVRPPTSKHLRSDGAGHGEKVNGKRIEDQPDLASAVRVGLRQAGHRF